MGSGWQEELKGGGPHMAHMGALTSASALYRDLCKHGILHQLLLGRVGTHGRHPSPQHPMHAWGFVVLVVRRLCCPSGGCIAAQADGASVSAWFQGAAAAVCLCKPAASAWLQGHAHSLELCLSIADRGCCMRSHVENRNVC